MTIVREDEVGQGRVFVELFVERAPVHDQSREEHN